MADKQVPLFTKVIDIRAAKQSKKGQQYLLEQEERYVPFSAIEHSFQQMNACFSEQQIHLTDKVDRLTSSLERLVPEFELGISGQKPHLYVDALTTNKKADIATIESALPSEVCYPYLTSDLAQLIGMHHSRLGNLFKVSGIYGDKAYHYQFKTGLKGNGCQRYKMTALFELYQRAQKGKFKGIKQVEILKLEKYLKMREIES